MRHYKCARALASIDWQQNGRDAHWAPRPSLRTAPLVDRQPLATDSSAFGLSKNCSSSVDPLSAVVD
jgi:hypothetical protein